jgi:hypothetical protein
MRIEVAVPVANFATGTATSESMTKNMAVQTAIFATDTAT